MVALSVMGSAILLFSCERDEAEDAAASEETMRTEYSENLSIVESQNGRRSYHFVTPLVEGYSLAREPYREFRKGVKITTYKWEAKGNVVVVKSDGKNLYTQQLFWNQQTKKIYSNVDSKIVQNDGRDVFIGEGFESDEEFKDWRFRRMKGRMEVEVKPTEQEVEVVPDSTAGSRTGASGPVPAPQSWRQPRHAVPAARRAEHQRHPQWSNHHRRLPGRAPACFSGPLQHPVGQ